MKVSLLTPFLYLVLVEQEILFNVWSFTGPLPPPEDIHISESNNSLVIEWNPPYSAINTNSNVIHVDPHITHYTVYIVDNYTGNYMERVNVTETSFRRNVAINNSCPMYGVTAWNSGGEGDMSVPLPGYLPRSKLMYCEPGYIVKLITHLYFCISVPSNIASEDIDIHREAAALDIRLHVSCD